MKIFDLHCDTISSCETGKKELFYNDLHVDIEKMIKGEAYAQCFAIFLDQEACYKINKTPYERYMQMYNYFINQLEKNSVSIELAHSVGEIHRISLDKKISAILTVEGGEVLEGDIEKLEKIYTDGVRLLTLTWNYENCIGFSHSIGGGLKTFGFEVVERMHELGMLVDVSHLSDDGFYDVMSVSKKPIIASHSCARSICSNSRNLTDDMLKMIGNSGGVVGLNFFRKFLDNKCEVSTLEMLGYHARHIVNFAGIEALALGSDFDGIDGELEWKDYAGMQMIVQYLDAFFHEAEMEKICYKNAERIFRV